jgi:hypothetical protein
MSAGKRGRKQNIEISLVATFALLLVRSHGVEPTPAARAAILAYFTWVDHPRPDLQVDIYVMRVLKALQRLRSGERGVHPAILHAVGWCDRSTNAPIFGTPQELAASVAKFLPSK